MKRSKLLGRMAVLSLCAATVSALAVGKPVQLRFSPFTLPTAHLSANLRI